MNMRDLSKDDDFLSHLLVEKLGTGNVPLLVHKMDSSRRLPKLEADHLLKIVKRLVATKGPVSNVIRQAVDDLLVLGAIRFYLKSYTQKQINAFATHASRYFELYHPSGCIEIAHTSRYSHHTGKSELCILATRNLVPGAVITELKGSMANLTDEEDRELKRTDLKNSDIRRDFSVIHSKQMKKNHLFLGPARFVNHDCNNNCELFREGKYITFRVLRPIAIGEEITAHYGDGYFGRKNRHCLCETCEKRGRGGYAPDHTDEDPPISSDSETDSSQDSDSDAESNAPEKEQKPKNLNERRTRRGVYAVMAEEDSEDSDNEADDAVLPEVPTDIGASGEIELAAEVDAASDLTSLPPSRAQSDSAVAGPSSLPTPGMVSPAPSALTSLSPAPTARSASVDDTPKSRFRSTISTRGQTTNDSVSTEQLMTPPLTEVSEPAAPAPKRMTRSVSAHMLATKRADKGKQKASQPSTPVPASGRSRKGKEKEVDVKKEETEPPRTLRARPSVPVAVEVSKEPPPKREIPEGPDGKPLPTCSTCSNVLPVISVDDEVVWGMEPSNKKNKKKQDCPRCMRHFAIYGQPWPCRISADGPYLLPTPREEATPVESASRRVNKKALSVLDRKLAAAAAAASPKKRQREVEERPALKRRKTEPVLHVETTKSQRVKSTKAGLHSLSAPPAKGIRTYGKGARKRARSPSPIPSSSDVEDEEEEPEPEPPQEEEEEESKVEAKVQRKKKATTPQPTLSRAQRAVQREKVRSWLQKQEKDGEDEEKDERSSARKRSSADIEDLEDHPRRKMARAKEQQLPLQKVLPRPMSGFRGGQLFSKPNPLNYALHAWASPVVSTPSSSEDELAPVTPEDELTVDLPSDPCGPIFPSASIIDAFKPSPFSFARRRWGSASIPSQDESKNRAPRHSPDPSESDKEPPSSSLSPDSAGEFLPWYPNDDTGVASSPISSLPEVYQGNVWFI
ncbi:hypothetical protein FB45DRAFT_732872 [Roridomyces roridus]|uniref:SET domain-containing protein n=1 Tax=Roridomyces roridus TaxID=1738132 RepID=A0AAD7FWI9_9AGAR|nr:hypothetical protein FB45DRAFT_732872 [Roridomyces roridus]